MNDRVIETPSVWIDAGKMDANIRKMAKVAETHGVALRPHAKTHKMPEIAKRQIEAGAVGITVAKISEAEVMADGGIRDIFVAYPIVGMPRIERVLRLNPKIRLIVGVDSYESASQLSQMAEAQTQTVEVRLESDTGYKRTGVPYDDAVELAKRIAGLKGLRLNGIYTFRGAFANGKPTLDLSAAGQEEGELMSRLADRIRESGIPIQDVSVGSTPTGPYAAAVEGVTEIRPGTYVFQDRMQAKIGACTLDDCAAEVRVTVVSRPDPNLIVVDGGSKTFATDVQPNSAPSMLEGFGYVVGSPDAILERMSEEHGMIRVGPHHPFKVGDVLRIVPNHICSTINLHNKVNLVEGDQVTELQVKARGMLV